MSYRGTGAYRNAGVGNVVFEVKTRASRTGRKTNKRISAEPNENGYSNRKKILYSIHDKMSKFDSGMEVFRVKKISLGERPRAPTPQSVVSTVKITRN